MWHFLRGPSVDLAITSVALTVLTATPAWALVLPGPPAGGFLAGGAIIATLVVTKWWRRR